MKYEVAIIGIKSPSFFSYYTFFKDLLFVPKILESFGILGNCCCQRCNPFFTCEFRTTFKHYGLFSTKKVQKLMCFITVLTISIFFTKLACVLLVHKQPTVYWKKTATLNWIYQIQISKSKRLQSIGTSFSFLYMTSFLVCILHK